jgi:DNA-binding MarR family transcriptional regulator
LAKRKEKFGPGKKALKAWNRFLQTAHGVQDSVETDLKQAGLPPIIWYDVLKELSDAGSSGLRPLELIERMQLAQYNASRLLARMDKQGLIERLRHPEDGRGQIVRITPEGRDMRRRIWLVYAPSIASHFGDHLAGGDAKTLMQLLSNLQD